MLVFDLESNGLLGSMTNIHCLWIHNSDTNEFLGFNSRDNNIEEGVRLLNDYPDEICGHNITQFDIPAIRKIYPWFNPKARLLDTTIMSRLGCPDIRDMDFSNKSWLQRLPPKFLGRHSLKSWGYRLGVLKGDYGDSEGAWESFSDQMYDYCRQDVVVTIELYKWLKANVEISDKALDLETKVASIISRQECYGVNFDDAKAWKLYQVLCDEREKSLAHLRTLFPPIRKLVKEFVAKSNNKRYGYTKGQLIQKFEDIEFNPGSNDHVEYWLKKRHDWKPSEFTKTGEVKIDEEILSDLDNLPEVPFILKYRMLVKRISQLADGDQGWLKRVARDGRIHGGVIPCGAVTRRMTHNSPNLAQVPAKPAEYWGECRSLFRCPDGMLMVGCDASQLELRTMAHLMHRYDNGAYVRAAIHGSKENNDDIHCLNAKAFGVTRDQGKTMFYALVYGAGDEKLGRTKTKSWDRQENRRIGKQCRDNLMKGLPALKKLLDTIQIVYRSRGHFVDADGQKFRLRSTHSAFNTINQRLGAIIMKRAMVILDDTLQNTLKLIPGSDYEFMLTVHDEWQLAVKPQYAEVIGKTAVDSIRKAGEYYELKCPLDGDYRIGNNWKETH